jgi:hypothetical protein
MWARPPHKPACRVPGVSGSSLCCPSLVASRSSQADSGRSGDGRRGSRGASRPGSASPRGTPSGPGGGGGSGGGSAAASDSGEPSPSPTAAAAEGAAASPGAVGPYVPVRGPLVTK